MMRVSGSRSTTPIMKSASAKINIDGSRTKDFSLEEIGADMDTVFREVNRANAISSGIMGAERPSNMWYRLNGETNYWYQYSLMDWYVSEVSVLSTIIQRTTTELLRYGLELLPKFTVKCMDCGEEMKVKVDKCPYCRSTNLRPPDPKQKKFLIRASTGKSFIDECNDNGQSWKDVLKAYSESQIQNGQAYTLCVTGDRVDSDGKRIKNTPLEFIPIDPKFVRFLYDDTGRPGTKFAFTMDDRNNLLNMEENPDLAQMYKRDGKVLYPAYWKIGSNYGGSGKYWVYTKNELYQDKWGKQSLTYGIPIWLDIEDDLLAYHYIEKHNLKKYKYGYVRKILVLPGFSDDDVEDITRGIADVLATNDNSIPIICTPPQQANVAKMEAQTLELGTESSADLMQIKDDIRHRLCAHASLPDIFAGDTNSSGGMNNESQQITLMDRFLTDRYEYLDRQNDWFMSFFPGCEDWILRVSRPGKAQILLQKRMDQIQLAQGWKALGFQVHLVEGELVPSEKTIEEMQMEEQKAQQAQAPMAVRQGGGPPGQEADEDMPDKGTARRADSEINASKEEIEGSMDEARESFSASFGGKDYHYRLALSQQGWDYFLAKDVYGFLQRNGESLTAVLTAGKQMRGNFKTLNPDQVKRVYMAILQVLIQPRWDYSEVKDVVLRIGSENPGFTEGDADRIAKTELERILNFAKEQMYKSNKLTNLCVWVGPLDDKTTPMCRYVQCGQLKSSKYDYTHLASQLPAWKAGFTLDELKEFLHKTWEVFHEAGVVRTDWVTDWVMHIGCRHTFQPITNIPRSEGGRKPEDFTTVPSVYKPLSDVDGVRTIKHNIMGLAFTATSGDERLAFIPTNAFASTSVFQFDSLSVEDVARWAKTVALMQYNGESRLAIHDMLKNETNMNVAEIGFIQKNAKAMYDMLRQKGYA